MLRVVCDAVEGVAEWLGVAVLENKIQWIVPVQGDDRIVACGGRVASFKSLDALTGTVALGTGTAAHPMGRLCKTSYSFSSRINQSERERNDESEHSNW